MCLGLALPDVSAVTWDCGIVFWKRQKKDPHTPVPTRKTRRPKGSESALARRACAGHAGQRFPLVFPVVPAGQTYALSRRGLPSVSTKSGSRATEQQNGGGQNGESIAPSDARVAGGA